MAPCPLQFPGSFFHFALCNLHFEPCTLTFFPTPVNPSGTPANKGSPASRPPSPLEKPAWTYYIETSQKTVFFHRSRLQAINTREFIMAKAPKYVYHFGKAKTDGDSSMKNLLGGKGANLAEMCRIGLPVPPGFTISTEVCTYYYDNKRTYPAVLKAQIAEGVKIIEAEVKAKFGDLKNPLLVSVRSGARDSMPGMMDTILNLGLNDETVVALANKTKNERFAWDCYRRFVQMYGDVVLGVQKAAGRRSRAFRSRHRRPQAGTPRRSRDRRHQAHRRRPQGTGRPLPEADQGPHRQELPQGSLGPAGRRHRRRVRLLDERPRHRLPPQVQHPQRMGHGRQRAGHGLRQHRREFRFRRGLHPRPRHRREGLLRRIPDQRPGRRRGGRRAHPAARHRDDPEHAQGIQGTGPDPHQPREALQGHAGLRVHHRGRRGLHAPDP